MRILQIISHYVPAFAFGGPLQVAHGLGRALVAAGHDVTVCCTNLKSPDDVLDVPTDECVVVDGVRVFYEPVPFGRYWGFSPRLAFRAWREAATADLIITHFHYQFASVIGASVARRRRVPYVVFAHGSLNLNGMRARRGRLKMAYLRMVERSAFRNATFVAFHTDAERTQSFHASGGSKLVPIGVGTQSVGGADSVPLRKRFPEIGSRVTFVFLGRLGPGKGLHLLFEAFARVVEHGIDGHLVLIGADERGYAAQLAATAITPSVAERITWTGLLTGVAKDDVLGGADVFVLPSRSEGSSVATLEAMAAGIPVIVTDRVGTWPEVEQARAGTVVPYDAGALEVAMREMALRSDRRELGANGRTYVRAAHDWNRIAAQFVTDIEEARRAAAK